MPKVTNPKNKKQSSAIYTFISPESSNVEGASYAADTKEMVVAFRDKKKDGSQDSYYLYKGVTMEDWTDFVNAPSKGKYVREVLKVKYKGIKQ